MWIYPEGSPHALTVTLIPTPDPDPDPDRETDTDTDTAGVGQGMWAQSTLFAIGRELNVLYNCWGGIAVERIHLKNKGKRTTPDPVQTNASQLRPGHIQGCETCPSASFPPGILPKGSSSSQMHGILWSSLSGPAQGGKG